VEKARVAVWDLPVRLFHWLFAALIAAAWWTGEEEMVEWHYRIGLAILGLLVFRLVWGFIGSSTARFAGFVGGPRAILDYLRGRSPLAIGHNPLGALSVLALLGLVALEVGLGLFASDEDGLLTGPFASLVSDDTAERLTELHEDAFDWLVVLIALHVAAILWYLFVRRKNLVAPMITGWTQAPAGTPAMVRGSAWRAVLAALAAFAAVSAVWYAGS
jgi:cytochrome b